MSRATFYVQECPTCGRSLQVRVEYLGRTVLCQHCGGTFEARDPANGPPTAARECGDLLQRVDQLLASADARRVRPR